MTCPSRIFCLGGIWCLGAVEGGWVAWSDSIAANGLKRRRIDVGARHGTNGWARRFGVSHRHFAGKRSRGHACAWRIIILVLAGRMGRLRGVLAGASFCAPFCV